ARAAEPQPLPAHRLHVLRPLVDQRHVAPRLRQQPPHDAPDRARPDDADPVEHARAAYSRTFAPGKAALYFPPMTPNHVKQRLRAGKASFGSLLNFGDPLVAELMASAGFDWLLVDTEHGPIDLATLATMFATITRYPCAPFVRVHALLSVPGIDACYVGPNDWCASAGLPPSLEPPHPEFEAAMQKVLAAARRHGIAAGIHCLRPETVNRRIREGWSLVGMVNDQRFLVSAAKAARDAVKTDA